MVRDQKEFGNHWLRPFGNTPCFFSGFSVRAHRLLIDSIRASVLAEVNTDVSVTNTKALEKTANATWRAVVEVNKRRFGGFTSLTA